MIDILEQYKGKVVTLCLKGDHKLYFSGIIDKINYESKVLRIQNWKRYIFININEIAVISEKIPGNESDSFEDHVVPNAFT